MNEQMKGEKERVIKKINHPITLKIAGAGIFAALSLVLSITTTEFLPRVQWGLALFDPVSVIWILAFFIFGYEAGILTSIAGMFLLFPFDPYASYLGPIMKFTATVPLIIIPLIINFIRRKPRNSDYIFNNKTLIISWISGTAVRVIVMVFYNIIIINLMFGGDEFASAVSLEFLGFTGITGWTAIVWTVAVINILQSIWDYLIPLILIKPIKKGRISLPW
jgi:riboflavin transporter FmnP